MKAPMMFEQVIKKLKWIILSVIFVLVGIIVFQNTDDVETKVLFSTITTTRASLMISSGIVGFLLGILTAFIFQRKTL